MSYATMLATVKTAVEGVSNVGNVRDYVRYWTTEKAFRDLMETTISSKKQIRGWLITRDGSTNERKGVGGLHEITHRFVVRGFLGLEDGTETEKTFQALVDAVVVRLDQAVTLSGGERGLNPAQVREIGHRELGNVLCHYAEIEFDMVEQVQRTYT